MTGRTRTALVQYGAAVAFTGLAVLVRWLFDPWLGVYLPFATLFGAVAAAVWCGGYRPGLLATVLGYLACYYLFIEPRGRVVPHGMGQFFGLVIYLLSCSIIIGIGEALHAGRRRLEKERTRLQESEERFRFLAETIPSIVWTAAPDGAITYTNQQWLRYCGLTPEQNARNWPELVLHPDDYQRCLEHWNRALRDGTEYEIEVRNRRHDGVYRWFITRAVPLKDSAGRVIAWFGVTTDIHDQKVMQEQLREADRRKNEFLAALAHELRNPLAPIRNALQILKANASSELELQWSRRVIERQVRQMARLLDDLLDVSRITRGKLELRQERVELAAVVESAVETSRPLIEAGRHELTLSLPPRPIHFVADPARLAQVFSNLLNNAAKYTDRGGHIWLTAARHDGEIVASVKDTGIGIAAGMVPRIFEVFTQATPALERSQGGLGVGLSLVRGLVELHGGRVEVRSDGPGKGSEFVVRLPVLEEVPVPERLQPMEECGGKAVTGSRILVVDDNRDSADSLAMMLGILGNDVCTAYDGEEALRAAEEFGPAVVLLDIGMPKLNGYEAARRIREQAWGGRTILIALTGWGQEEDRRRTEEAGFDHHMVKPVDPDALVALLATFQPTPR